MNRRQTIFSVSAVLVGINLLIFLAQSFSTRADLLITEKAIMDGAAILGKGEYYRLFTAMFLHADVEHLASNMLILYFVGIHVERMLGKLPYLLLYLTSGICGNLVSLAWQLHAGNLFRSLGASGAVFGVVGAYFISAFLIRKYIGKNEMQRIAFGVFYSLYIGFRSVGVDNAAHLGGFAAGVLETLLLRNLRRRRSETGR